MLPDEVRKVVECLYCGRSWERNCEQHACLVLFGECIACRFSPNGKGSRNGTSDDLDAIQAKRREMVTAHLSENSRG